MLSLTANHNALPLAVPYDAVARGPLGLPILHRYGNPPPPTPPRPMPVRPLRPLGSASSTGFVLVATLVAIAIISLGAAYFASQVDTLRNSARQLQSWSEAERDAFSVREMLQYAATTGLRDEGGLTFANTTLATDGRRYRLTDTLSVSVQDERGLLAINTLDEGTISRLLSSIGIPTESHSRLIDTLLDYMDPDDLRRLNGAEAREYAAANKPAPANDFLRTRDQLADILGWDTILDRLDIGGPSAAPGLKARFIDLFSAARHVGLNVNSAPLHVLRTVPGFDPTKISALIDQRRATPFTSLGQLAPFTSGAIDSDYVGLFGANDWRVVVTQVNLPFLLECQLTNTPAEPDRPTRLRECVRRPVMAGAAGRPDEFQRALAVDRRTESRQSLESKPPSSSTLVLRNALRDPTKTVDAAAPDWLAEVISATGATRQSAIRSQ